MTHMYSLPVCYLCVTSTQSKTLLALMKSKYAPFAALASARQSTLRFDGKTSSGGGGGDSSGDDEEGEKEKEKDKNSDADSQ